MKEEVFFFFIAPLGKRTCLVSLVKLSLEILYIILVDIYTSEEREGCSALDFWMYKRTSLITEGIFSIKTLQLYLNPDYKRQLCATHLSNFIITQWNPHWKTKIMKQIQRKAAL